MKSYYGQILIVAMLGVAVAAAGFGWWFRLSATGRALRFWGADVARQIRDAPVLSGLCLAPLQEPGDKAQLLQVDGRRYTIELERDLSGAPGQSHLRQALLEDRSYQWSGVERPRCWALVLVFGPDDPAAVRIVFDETLSVIGLVAPDGSVIRMASCAPISAGLRTICRDWELPLRSERESLHDPAGDSE